MTTLVQSTDAAAFVSERIKTAVLEAAGSDLQLSPSEAVELPQFIQPDFMVDQCAEPSSQSLSVEEVTGRAIESAISVLHAVNPPDQRGGAILSQKEVAEITKRAPSIGAMFSDAYVHLRSGVRPQPDMIEQPSAPPIEQLLAFLENPGNMIRLSADAEFGTEIDARKNRSGRSGVPPEVLTGFDHAQIAEENDWGAVTLKTFELDGTSLYSIQFSPPDGHGYVELYDSMGVPLVSGRTCGNSFLDPDAEFGLSRYVGELSFIPETTEGYSEDSERFEYGQILSTWQPEATVSTGSISHDGISVTGFSTEEPLSDLFVGLVHFVLTLMYPRSLMNRAEGPGPIDLMRNAIIRIGTHVDPRNGERTETVDYADIDNDSYTFYFQRSANGVLIPVRITTNG